MLLSEFFGYLHYHFGYTAGGQAWAPPGDARPGLGSREAPCGEPGRPRSTLPGVGRGPPRRRRRLTDDRVGAVHLAAPPATAPVPATGPMTRLVTARLGR